MGPTREPASVPRGVWALGHLLPHPEGPRGRPSQTQGGPDPTFSDPGPHLLRPRGDPTPSSQTKGDPTFSDPREDPTFSDSGLCCVSCLWPGISDSHQGSGSLAWKITAPGGRGGGPVLGFRQGSVPAHASPTGKWHNRPAGPAALVSSSLILPGRAKRCPPRAWVPGPLGLGLAAQQDRTRGFTSGPQEG